MFLFIKKKSNDGTEKRLFMDLTTVLNLFPLRISFIFSNTFTSTVSTFVDFVILPKHIGCGNLFSIITQPNFKSNLLYL